ncbi:sulfatase family protein [Dictyobacter aurantiacus]|uniref:Sulfatase n=1 Tax=Dictyobacter aurantiacus TaxID=1936993 RepID=A0A401ZNC7_9CHLR|nr:sulfatase [Dictyobacter aurantiacus]GCE08365.1 sulfatase [Dictyobacter aurantiacus]
MTVPAKLPNIVVVAIDSLRADHLGCYGYARPTSPHIDALAAESQVFEQAIAAGIPTMPSFTTLYTGLHPYRHGVVAHTGQRRLSSSIQMLPQMLKQRGYVTAACDNLAVQGEGRGSWFARGYDYYSGFLYKPFGDQSQQLTERALNLLQEYADQPLFLFLHYWDPHTPYGPLPPYDTMHYEPNSGPIDLAEVRKLRPEYYNAFLGDMHLRHPNDYAYVVAQYDGEISQVDAEVGRLTQALKAQALWENTIFVLLSDHGECFGEGDFYFDHHGLYDAVTRIAFMLHLPGMAAGRISPMVSHLDIVPTLAEMVGLPPLPYALDGKSLLPLLNGATSASPHPYIVSAESSRQASLALRTPEWKVILPIVEDLHGQPLLDFYGRPRSPQPLLFDLCNDPAEQHDLSQQQPEKLAEMLDLLRSWRARMATMTGEPDPIQAQGLSLSYERFMKRLLARQKT